MQSKGIPVDIPVVSRRDALKLGVFGAAALTLPLSTTLQASSVSTISTSKLVPYQTAFAIPPVAKPVPMEQRPAKWQRSDVDYYRLEQTEFSAQVLKGVNTKLWGYGGCVPGPTIRATRNRKASPRSGRDGFSGANRSAPGARKSLEDSSTSA